MIVQLLEGHRSNEDQLKAFNAGKSRIKSGGKHNHSPSLATDVAPWPIDWSDKNRFTILQEQFKAIRKNSQY